MTARKKQQRVETAPLDANAPPRVLTALLRGAGFTLVLLNEDFTVEWVSDAARALAGWSLDDIVGHPAFDFVHPDDLPELADIALHHVEHPEEHLEGGSYQFMGLQIRLRTADGGWRQCEVFSTNQYLDPDVNGLLLLVREATIERAYEDVLDLLSEGVGLGAVSDPFHRFFDQLTKGASAIVLGSPGEAIVVSSGTIALRDRDLVDGPWRRAIDDGEPVYVTDEREVAALIHGSGPHHQSFWAVPLVAPTEGTVVGCLVVSSPIAGPPRPWIGFWLRRATRLLALAIDRDKAMAQLRRAAYEDALTGVANRARLFGELEHRLIRSAVAVLFIDLDDLKGVNDTYGHAIGDEAIVASVRRIQSVVRPSDLVARVGGDEFVVACSDTHTVDEAEHLAQRIIEAFADPFALGPHLVRLGVSIGVARSGGASSASALVSRADAAMYEAKQAGKRRWRV